MVMEEIMALVMVLVTAAGDRWGEGETGHSFSPNYTLIIRSIFSYESKKSKL